jgi:predicted nucleic acid-binding protein
MTALVAPIHNHDFYTVRITGPEMIAAFERKVRMKELSQTKAKRLAHNFRADWQHRYQIVEISAAIAEHGMNLATQHPLRGYDAVYLAAALAVHDLRRTLALPALTFVSADSEQLRIASAEGLLTENPSRYP